MKNPAIYLKRSLATLLSGNISFNSTVIPYYEREGEVTPNQVIFINDTYDGSEANKHGFVYRGNFTLDVVTVKKDSTSKLADGIAETVMNLIKPDTRTNEVLSGDDFQIMILGGPLLNPLREDTLNGEKVFRRLIRWNILMVER